MSLNTSHVQGRDIFRLWVRARGASVANAVKGGCGAAHVQLGPGPHVLTDLKQVTRRWSARPTTYITEGKGRERMAGTSAEARTRDVSDLDRLVSRRLSWRAAGREALNHCVGGRGGEERHGDLAVAVVALGGGGGDRRRQHLSAGTLWLVQLQCIFARRRREGR